MPIPATVPELLDLVRRSTLIPDGKLNELLSRCEAAGISPQTVDQLTSLLVREGLITFFQAKQLKLGRYKRFTIAAKYRLLELVGSGGMGAVYLCEHTLMRRLVALKVLPVEKLEDKSNEERFYREARAVAALDHPNIVRAYDIDHYEKLHFIVMEYVDGASLQEVIARYAMEKQWFNPVRAAHYIAQSAVGMQHAHELGMVHRDIKPGNLLLDRTGVIKVLDMGLARFFNKQQDSVTEKYDDKCVLGTADYLAPEQAVSNMVDIRADIYALGGTLYFMLTAQTPFPDGTIAAKLVAHQTREPRPVESFRKDVPPGLLAVLRKMMAKNPDDRYQEPIEVAEALAEWAERPIDPPAAREMPAHCPLVQALSCPNPISSGSSSALARAIFGNGRGSRAGSGSGSASGRTRKAVSGKSTSKASLKPGTPPDKPPYSSRGDVPLAGPVSTARASASPTAAIPQVPSSGRGSSSSKSAYRAKPATVPQPTFANRPRRNWVYIVFGFLLASLFILAAVGAYYVGRGESKASSPAIYPSGAGYTEMIAHPTLDEPALCVQEVPTVASGTIVLVQFKVESVGGEKVVHLNSRSNPKESGNIAALIKPAAYGDEPKMREQVLSRYLGKTIRVRGKAAHHAGGEHVEIDVNSLGQVLVVSEP